MADPFAMISADHACARLCDHQPGLELRADWADEETAKGLLEIHDAHGPPWSFLSLIQKGGATEMESN